MSWCHVGVSAHRRTTVRQQMAEDMCRHEALYGYEINLGTKRDAWGRFRASLTSLDAARNNLINGLIMADGVIY